jgi:hypothetical protein
VNAVRESIELAREAGVIPDDAGQIGAVMINSRSSNGSRVALLLFAEESSEPCAVAKIATDPEGGQRLCREHEALSTVRALMPSRSLDRVPEPMSIRESRHYTLLVERAVRGRSVSTAISQALSLRRRQRFSRCVELGELWLEDFSRIWNGSGPSIGVDALAREEIDSFTSRFSLTTSEGSLLDALGGTTRSGAFENVMAVASHRDFSADHVMIDGDAVSVIDWGSFDQLGIPLEDVFSLVTSAGMRLLVARNDSDWRLTFRRIYWDDTWLSRFSSRVIARACYDIGLGEDAVDPLFCLYLIRRANSCPTTSKREAEKWRALFRMRANLGSFLTSEKRRLPRPF